MASGGCSSTTTAGAKRRRSAPAKRAERAKRKIEARLVLGDFRILEDQKEPTFAEYSEQWLKRHAETQCKPSTVARYCEILRLYLLPSFWNYSARPG